MFSVGRGAESCSLLDETLRENSHNLPLWRIAVTTSFARAVVSMATDRRVNYTTINQSPLVVAEACVVIGEMFARRWLANRLESIHVAASNFRFVQSASSYVLTVNVDSNTVFTLYSRFYNRLCELCKWAQPSGAWAVQPGRSYLFNYLLSLILRDGKIRSITKLYCIYLFIYYMNIHNVSWSSRFYNQGCKVKVNCVQPCVISSLVFISQFLWGLLQNCAE